MDFLDPCRSGVDLSIHLLDEMAEHLAGWLEALRRPIDDSSDPGLQALLQRSPVVFELIMKLLLEGQGRRMPRSLGGSSPEPLIELIEALEDDLSGIPPSS